MATTFAAVASRLDEKAIPTGLEKKVFGLLTTDGNDGAAATDIAASVFGLTAVTEISPAVKSDNTIIVVLAPVYNATTGAGAYVIGKAAATAAAADIPSGTYAVTVKGY